MSQELHAEIARLQTVINGALTAMDEGRMGDVRRILKTGQDKPVIAQTGVIAKDGR